MSQGYSHGRVQEYWQSVWEREGVYRADDASDPTYVLGMFPYTSGELHMGHVRNYTITDAYARYRRMQGDDVLHPMGWDAFGLPAENAAYDRDTDPRSWTETCITQMREEMETMGFGYDWSREVTTCDPDYYRWNQWLFTRFYEAGLVDYEAATVNWCPDCETVLADAQVATKAVDSGGADDDADADVDTEDAESVEVCWRCETPVSQRDLDQWFFRITDYADELHEGLDDLGGWSEGVREIQRNWIGRREGATVTFDVDGRDATVDVFTTRLDTVYGGTFVALAPGHDLARELATEDETVAQYVDMVRNGPDGERTSGLDTGVRATHPLTGESLPVYVAAYVLDDVGTGAVMGVPAHNERDHAFARTHDLPVEQVVEPVDGSGANLPDEPFTADGMLTGSGEYDGLASAAARERLLDADGVEAHVTYRLRDWLISRQRYWGTPIPVVHCDDCGHVLVPDEDLPVELPAFVQTTGNPLDASDEFVRTACPDCGQPARRETDTMDTFVDSSWYFLRFLSPQLETAPFDTDRANDLLPIDVYVGGDEHAVLHLLYIRFFTRALCDLGLLDVREPIDRLVNQGTVLYDGEKMSKSKGNAIAPHEYGAETTRLFVLSAAHPRQDFEWTAKKVSTSYDLQQQVYGLVRSYTESDEVAARDEHAPHDTYLERELDRTIAAITADYDRFRFHRVVSEIHGVVRLLRRYQAYDTPYKYPYERGLRALTRVIAPITPFLGEELWSMLGEDGLVAEARWPEPLQDVPDYRIERELVRKTLEDVRGITDVVGIDAPERIELVVAQPWKYRAYEIARDADPDAAVVGTVMADSEVKARGEAAAEFAADVAEQKPGLEPALDPETEQALFEQATWLFEEEFGADVVVRRATDDPDDDLARKARPDKPAIHID
ncbi:leucine--tRNA ligase [Salinigranum halophilum]|uniref:leucine--tRNA ligase n=1 Tax=Salinigranum halophilum TaxID=2565931 RepID=UPI00115DE921|nr:leucine--tRNA ligase [Salinigranum halophilum]